MNGTPSTKIRARASSARAELLVGGTTACIASVDRNPKNQDLTPTTSRLVVMADLSQRLVNSRTDGAESSTAYEFEIFSTTRRNLTLDAAPIPWYFGTG